ncbi:ArsR/SmtB family transcription factor [Luethyella okanaganae]|uniref:ArsR/SmtB family transcription factor n=1 Tax=Luethyella okanaganae TaxID=69372 RepID=A0ABW1VDT6_9MICO
MEPDGGVSAALAALASRVEALEANAEQALERSPAESSGTMWVLDGIKRRVSAPGAVFYAGVVHTAAGPVEWQIGLPVERLLGEEWSVAASSLASLGNPVRLKLLHAVIEGASSVAELSAGEGMGTTGQLYHHLNQLLAQGWLAAAGRGRYAIPPERVVPLLVILAAARRTS